MFNYHVLCLGSATLDHFLAIDQKFKSIKPGDKILVKSSERHSGGGATNAGAALAKLGLKVKILSKLGHDPEAHFIEQEMQRYQVKNLCLHHSRHHTDFSTLISSTKEKDRIIYVHKGASQDLTLNDFKKSQLKADWIYLASLMGESFQTALEIVKYAEKKRIKLLFNPSLYLCEKGKNYLAPVLKNTKVLVLNQEEASALVGSRSIQQMLLNLQQLGPSTVVITNGPRKLYALHHHRLYTLTPAQVKVVHTAGAGDAFTSGLLAGIIKNYPFEEALCLGQVNSYSVIQHIGTKNKLLTESEAQQMIRKYKIKVNKTVLKRIKDLD